MNSDTMRSFLQHRPFEPFEVRLSSGERHQVRHPENALVTKSTLVIAYPDTEQFVWCALLRVASVERLHAA